MLFFTESFDGLFNNPTDKWISQFGNINTGTARTGALGFTGNGEWLHRWDPAHGHATFICGLAHRRSSGTLGLELRFRNNADAVDHVTLKVQTDGSIRVYRGTTAGTLLGSSAAGVVRTDGSWQYIEMKATLSDSTGVVVVRVDETVVVNLSGQDTKNGGSGAVFDDVWFQAPTGTNLDDIYVCNGAGSTNTDFVGAVRIEYLKPNGNGNSSGMTNSAGTSTNNYSYVDDADTGAGTDYVESDTAKDTYAFTNSTQPTGNSVKGVLAWAFAQKTDAGARGLDAVARSGGTETSTAMTPAVSTDTGLLNGINKWQYAVFETKPGGGSWTVSDVNAAEFGIDAT